MFATRHNLVPSKYAQGAHKTHLNMALILFVERKVIVIKVNAPMGDVRVVQGHERE